MHSGARGVVEELKAETPASAPLLRRAKQQLRQMQLVDRI